MGMADAPADPIIPRCAVCGRPLRRGLCAGTWSHQPGVFASCDLDADHSIARLLARRGFDVWIPSLRGTGDSEHRTQVGTSPEGFDFDAYALRDLPAIIGYVREKTNGREVRYIGHSMGGMILYAYLSSGGEGIVHVALRY